MYVQAPPRHIKTSSLMIDEEQMFVGRTDAIGEVFRLLSSPVDHILGFYGPRLIGKSSLLQELVSSLPKMGPYHPSYIELQDKSYLHISEVIESLTSALAKEFNLFLPLSRMIHKNKMTVDIFYEQFWPRLLETLHHNESLVLLFDTPFTVAKLLLQTLPMKNGVLQNDSEISNQDDLPLVGIPFLRFLTDLISQSNRQIKIVFTVKEHYINVPAFFPSEEIRWHQLSFLRTQETNLLIKSFEQKTGLKWSKEAMTQVAELTAGHPFLVQQLCLVVYERANREQQSRLSSTSMLQRLDVEAALFESLEKISALLSLWWQELSFTEQVVLASLAEAKRDSMSLGELSDRLLKERINIEEQLPQTISVLVETDLIHSVKGNYGFTVDLLRRWVAEYKPLKHLSQEEKAARLITYKFAPTTDDSLYGAAIPQKDAKPLSQVGSILTEQLKSKNLSVWKPQEHFRLLWWVMAEPQEFASYKAEFGTEYLYQVGKWLASTLIWLPLFIPSLAFATEALPRAQPVSLNDLSLTVSLFMAWLLTGWFGDRQDDVPVMVGVMASGFVTSTVMLGLTGSLMSALAGSFALGIALGMSTRLALAVAFSVTDRLGSAVGLGMVGGIIFAAIILVMLELGQQMPIGMMLGVALIVLFILTGSMLLRFNPDANKERSSLLGMISFALLLLSHIFLLCYSFLGGWQLFALAGF